MYKKPVCEYNGKIYSIPELSEITGINKHTLYDRYHRGLVGDELVNTEYKPRKPKKARVDMDTIKYLAKTNGLRYDAVRTRWDKGDRGSKLIRPSRTCKVKKYYEHFSELLSLSELTATTNIPEATLRSRYDDGLRDEDLIAPLDKRKTGEGVEFKHKGVLVTLVQLAQDTGIGYFTLWGRYQKGLRDDELVNPAVHTKIRIEYKGKTYTVKEVSELTGVNPQTLRKRFRSGKRGEELTAPTKYTRSRKPKKE